MVGDKTKISWADATWNPITGCSKISPGCKNCYAERMAKRLRGMGSEKYGDGFKVRIHPQAFDQPKRWTRPRRIFVCSMSDIFHPEVPNATIDGLVQIMAECPQHEFMVLTKRPTRLIERNIDWPDNVLFGVTVETQKQMHRVAVMGAYSRAHRNFVSFEPLIDEITLVPMHHRIDWFIVGGESGPGARPMPATSVDYLFSVAQNNDIPFFFKQWGGSGADKGGNVYRGRTWTEFPSTVDQRDSGVPT